MDKRASNKQLNYLNHILNSQDLKLSDFTNKNVNELNHRDIVEIFKKLDIPITPILNNYKYIIEYEDSKLNYIIGRQLHLKKNTEMKLICFKDFVIIDWDVPRHQNKDDFLRELKQHLINFPYTFYIYETYNGFHGYIMNAKLWFADWNTIKLLKDLKCDEFYIGFTRKVGFVVRLNKKVDREEEFIEKFVCKINEYPVLKNNELLLDIKDDLIQKDKK